VNLALGVSVLHLKGVNVPAGEPTPSIEVRREVCLQPADDDPSHLVFQLGFNGASRVFFCVQFAWFALSLFLMATTKSKSWDWTPKLTSPQMIVAVWILWPAVGVGLAYLPK